MPKFKVSFPLLFNAEFNLEIEKPDIKVAWDIYCELKTRVGIIDFVEDEDNIKICFESWYSIFKVVRNRLKDLKVPIKISKKYLNKNGSLDEILFNLLNQHMRPFLRKWHFGFSKYWDENYKKGKDPIQIQKNFPNYDLLINDIKDLRNKLNEILSALNNIVRWSKKKILINKIFYVLKITSIIIISLMLFISLYLFILFPFFKT